MVDKEGGTKNYSSKLLLDLYPELSSGDVSELMVGSTSTLWLITPGVAGSGGVSVEAWVAGSGRVSAGAGVAGSGRVSAGAGIVIGGGLVQALETEGALAGAHFLRSGLLSGSLCVSRNSLAQV